jgi:hypothetical protein
MAKRKWAFVPEGAQIKASGGRYSGPSVGGSFNTYIVHGGDGVVFERTPYADHGWKVEKNKTNYQNQKVQYNVTNEEDLAALDKFVGEQRYKGFGKYGD